MPWRGKIPDELVEVALGTDVDAGRGLVDDEHVELRAASHLARLTFCWLPPLRL